MHGPAVGVDYEPRQGETVWEVSLGFIQTAGAERSSSEGATLYCFDLKRPRGETCLKPG